MSIGAGQPPDPGKKDGERPTILKALYDQLGRGGVFTFALFAALIVCGAWIYARGQNQANYQIHAQYVVVMLVLLVFCAIAGRWLMNTRRFDGILIDERNRISLSRFQWVMWLALILGGYFTAALWNIANGAGAPLIQQDLLVLLGLSSGSAVTSGLIVEAKKHAVATPDARVAADAPPKPTGARAASIGELDMNMAPREASWAELYLGEEAADRSTIDISRLQQMIITVLLGITYVVLQWQALVKVKDGALAMPTFDDKSSFLWLLGLSHAAYIAYKAK